jgi:hypothetical protein
MWPIEVRPAMHEGKRDWLPAAAKGAFSMPRHEARIGFDRSNLTWQWEIPSERVAARLLA